MKSDDLKKIPKPFLSRLLLFLESNLTGQVIFDIKNGTVRSARILESIRVEDSVDGEIES